MILNYPIIKLRHQQQIQDKLRQDKPTN